jgi:hypothetical protein
MSVVPEQAEKPAVEEPVKDRVSERDCLDEGLARAHERARERTGSED